MQVIVSIHGTGRTARHFWIPQLDAIAQQLGTVPLYHPVWWGDMIDAGSRVSRAGAWISGRLHALAQFFLGRPARYTPRFILWAADRLHRLINGIAGVFAYFVTARKREAIRTRLRHTLRELTRHGHEIVLISESLGCLVAFDVLREEAHLYNVGVWITLGCPLRTLVRTRQRAASLGAINRQTVRQWLNLYAPRDMVASPIAAVFPDYPIWDERVEGASGRLEAHRYWANPRVPALIARILRG